jgi:hypothetical protein
MKALLEVKDRRPWGDGCAELSMEPTTRGDGRLAWSKVGYSM